MRLSTMTPTMGLWDLQAKLVRMLSLVSGVWLPALLLVPALFVYARMVFHVIKDLLHLGRPREQAPPSLPRVVLHYEVKTRPGPVTRAARAFTAAQKCLSEQLQRAARVERANKERENAEKAARARAQHARAKKVAASLPRRMLLMIALFQLVHFTPALPRLQAVMPTPSQLSMSPTAAMSMFYDQPVAKDTASDFVPLQPEAFAVVLEAQ